MRTVFVMFDSLNRLALETYGGSSIKTPNFTRFAERAVTFESHYAGSLPCMPARRDMHTGRLNFLHRSWGPLEPFDNSFSRTLSENGVYTHLISDHLHYFEDGGTCYANAFDSWDFIRGQEYDPIKPLVIPPIERYREMFDERHYPLGDVEPGKAMTRHSSPRKTWKKSRGAIINDFLQAEEDFPTAKCFSSAFEFLELNREADNWFLQLECFDPHEPFNVPERFKAAYASGYNGKILNWPGYEKVAETPEEIAEIRGNYAALVAMCDDYFGKLLDYFDEYDLWKDTALVLSTDHGFLLSEHEWWGKNRMPYYEEISHIPLMVWHPDHADQAGKRQQQLTQTPDLMPTFLDFHDCSIPACVTGTSIKPLLSGNEPIHQSIILGMFGGPICAVDDRYSYFRYPENIDASGLYLYTLMPAHLSGPFNIEELKGAELVGPFDFTKGSPLLKVPMNPKNSQFGGDGQTLAECATVLYDLKLDPGQTKPVVNPEVERRMLDEIIGHMQELDAPREMYAHYSLPTPP
ncbi:sulfatase [uncultured Cohaesibacter sp.]|uniref:sulfatase n=1 Tax=uncultured Cohaesibacter sp. TaxID=1002546 RepID=UPI0029C7CB70|nr:sulfatase [uncultured Cohaesibacter sp.]